MTFDDDLGPFTLLNHVRDMLGLVSALGYRSVAVVGHDYGSPVAAWCALTRPDVFSSVALTSAPFAGAPSRALNTANEPSKRTVSPSPSVTVNGEKRSVDVRPDTPLLWVLRDTLGLRGTGYDCCSGFCGACTVYLDGETIHSCVMAIAAVGERNVLTIEGFRALHEPSKKRRSRRKKGA